MATKIEWTEATWNPAEWPLSLRVREMPEVRL